MTKEEYYKISREQKLSLRCPCLDTCVRYRYTAYLIGKVYYTPRALTDEKAMQEMEILGHGENIEKMFDAGEPLTFIGGNRSYGIFNACPEFFLHPHQHKPMGMASLAVHQYSYDEEFKGDKFSAGESRHYTECPEYSLFNSKKSKSKPRRKIPVRLRAELQKEISSLCPFCKDDQVGHFHVHHIDENPENNEHNNLIMLCPTCHSKITKGDVSTEHVKKVKNRL